MRSCTRRWLVINVEKDIPSFAISNYQRPQQYDTMHGDVEEVNLKSSHL